MKRKKVTVAVTSHGSQHCEPVIIEAQCDRCVYWERHAALPAADNNTWVKSDHGDCHLNPRKRNKHNADWCGAFTPEED